jgi:hypothetical protein
MSISSNLQNKVLHTIGNFLRHTHIYDYITKLCRKQAKIIQNHGNANVHNIGQGKPWHRKLGGGQAYDHSSG